MKQQKWKSKSFALLLAIMMIFTMMSQMAFADDTAAAPQEAGSASSAQHVIVSTATELAQWGGVDFTGTIELAKNIDMTGVEMQPIKSLNGTFEGNGYTISNLTLSGEAETGYSAPNVGLALIARLSGTVQNLQMDNVQITSNSKSKIYAGAIVGMIEAANASITNCAAMGSITLPETATQDGAGGIVGGVLLNGSVAIADVYSEVSITNGNYTGGLIGIAQYAQSIKIQNCAVVGDLKVKTGGGIIGWLTSVPTTAERVYFGGKITGSKRYGFAYNNGYMSTLTVNSVYYDSTKNKDSSAWSKFEAVASSKVTGSIDGKSTDELKGLQLDGFTASADFNNYPVPSWLTTLGNAQNTVTVTADGADKVTLTKDGNATDMTVAGEGVFTASLAEGKYTYTAETSRADKHEAIGTLIVGKTDKSVTITLPNKVADTEITVGGPAEAVLKVYQGTDATGKLMQEKSAENGVYTYALQEGSYYYEATAEEYDFKSGNFTVPVADSKLTVTMDASQKYDVTFDISSGEKTPSVKVFRGEKIYQPKDEGGAVYALCSGTYSYEVTAEDCITKTGAFTVANAVQTVNVTLDGVTGDGSASNPYIIGSKEALVYFAQQVNSGVTKYVKGHVKLSSNIDLQDMSWTPIGPSWTSPFRGHFDGAGYTISGLNVTNARTYYGFFGCLDNATVEKLTLKGQVYCAEPYARVGGLAGYAIGDVTIRNCGSAVNVSALARGCEGVGGLVGGYEDGIEYKWEDHKMVIENSYNAGNVVCTGTDANATIGGLVGGNKNCVQLENCYNAGTVYGPGVQAAGLLGNAGEKTGDNCMPSMKGCYNAGQVVGAEGKSFGLYGKGTIAPANLQDCYVEAGTAADTKQGTTLVSDDATRQKMLAKLGNGWTIDPSKNNGKPYLNGTEPVAADTSLVDELGKYADTITVSANAAVGYELTALKSGAAAAAGITASITQSQDDIQKGYLTAVNHALKLLKKNESGAAVTETATLTLTKDGIKLAKPLSIVIYPAAEKLSSLIDTIANTYTGKSDEWVVFDMAAYEKLNGKNAKTSGAAKQNYLNLAINALAQNNALASDRAKGELILGALGIDTTKLTPYGGGKAYNNAAKLQAMNMNVSYYTAPWILLADEQGNVKLTDKQVQQLVKILTDNQGANGLCQGAYWGKTYDDIDTTGTALAALARFAKATADPYGVKDKANTFITKALAGLGKAQGENGSFGNVNTDAMVIAGLAAIGENPSNFKNNSSLADALTLYVNEGQSGFSSGYAAGTAGEKAQALATEQGFRALVVLEKLKEANIGMYNIYTGKISVAANPETKPEPGKTAASASGVGTPENSTSTPGGGTSSGQNIIAAISICPDSKTEWLSTTHTLAEGSTAADLIVKALDAAGMRSVGAGSGYVKSVTKDGVTLAEKEKGPNSGWMYTVNGKSTQAAINGYKLQSGDTVKLYYVEDYTKDAGSSGWAPAAPGGEQKPEDQNKDKQTAEEPKDEETKDDAAKVKALTGDLGLKARSVKTAKGHIKVRLLADAKMQAAIKELQDMGYTVKYRFYRSTKKAAAYRSAVTKKTASYTNTSGKKGVKYFYKVQLRVYDENGKLIAATALKQCQYAARSWTK